MANQEEFLFMEMDTKSIDIEMNTIRKKNQIKNKKTLLGK
jgi:hypothetical protein